MDYIGSKEKLNSWMFPIMLKGIAPADFAFVDACAGSGSVSKYASSFAFSKIISNDIMEFPSHIVRGSVCLPVSKKEESVKLINKINSLKGEEGFFYNNYSEKSGRLYFSNDNAAKIDAGRIFIEEELSQDLYLKSYTLYCMLEAISSVSNTTGVQAAFLKKLKTRALQPLLLKEQKSLHKYGLVKTYISNILTLLKNKEYIKYMEKYPNSILYIDPPYNQRQYGPNYHLYETFVKYDNPKIFGKTGLRDWKEESKSDFCSKTTCLSFIKEIVNSASSKFIYMSYSSDSILSKDEICNSFSNIEAFEFNQKRYKSDANPNKDYNNSELKEYLFKITK